MLCKLLIILFSALPPTLAFAANTKSAADLSVHLQNHPNDSNALYNLALTEQRAGKPALSLALSEKSLFINPLNFDAAKLKNISADALSSKNSERIESVPSLYKVLDMLPYLLLFGVSSVALLVFASLLGSLYLEENITFKAQPKKRLHSALAASAAVLSLALIFGKTQSQSERWACVVSEEAQLYTGPSTQGFPQVSNLEPGNCSKVVLEKESWVSLSPAHKSAGWVQKNQVLIVRGQ